MFSKKLSLMVFLSLFLSSCIHKKQAVKKVEDNKSEKSEFIPEGGTYVFSTDVADEFDLSDESSDLFEGNKNGATDKDDFQWEEVVYDNDTGEVVRFDFDDTSIKPSEKGKIKHNAELAKQELASNPESKVSVKGHSCKIAKSELYNRAISQERAENVAKEYAANGVDRKKINAVGYGASELLTDEDGREAQAPNRRVETDFIIE